MIGIIDYGLGNVRAISNIYNKLKIQNIIIKSKKDFSHSKIKRTVMKKIAGHWSGIDSSLDYQRSN